MVDAAKERKSAQEVSSADYYGKCLIGGVLACGLTHLAMTPLDVVKCNIQVDPARFKSLNQGVRLIASEQGATALFKGWLPTFFGYSAQGALKFGLNEVFKDTYSNLVGQENYITYRGLVWAAASGSAEFFADIALCPFEMVKVRIQTSPTGTFPVSFGEALTKMNSNRAEYSFPFGSLVPLWSRQIPYTIAKFVGFEFVVETFYKNVFTEPKSSYSKSTQLGITFASGYIAGVVCAVVSQPADNLVSQMGKASNKGKGFGTLAAEQGMVNLFTKGLGTRILMIGTLTGLQWWIYDAYKTANGLGTSGGAVLKK
jgi:solute carrier family 25 phosphate transporter 3